MTKQKIFDVEGVRYTVDSTIESGGGGTVFKVRSSEDGRDYALKLIAKGKGSRTRDARFRKEIEFGLTSSHSNVLKIRSSTEDDAAFSYVMDLFPGSLREVIVDETDFEVLLDYLSQLCEGLAHIHKAGIVHRDIKPENILVDPLNRRLVIADFGISHFKNSLLTKHGELLANRNYQAPEQMATRDARHIRQPADVFALGLIMSEVFTKQIARGLRQRRVGDVYPFLSDLDLLIDRMMIQDADRRLGIEAVRDALASIRIAIDSRVEEIKEHLPSHTSPDPDLVPDVPSVLARASRDVLSAKYIFERVPAEALARYNANYHCEISYQVSEELYNLCVLSELYSMCRRKFEYEASGDWDRYDVSSVVTPAKMELLKEFEHIQSRFPLPKESLWSGMPRLAANYFRFCKDYHCDELLAAVRETISSTGPGSLQEELLAAPILWIVKSVRARLDTGYIDLSNEVFEEIAIERQVSIDWGSSNPSDPRLLSIGEELFDKDPYADSVAETLRAFESEWDVSFAPQADGRIAVHFRSLSEYQRFSRQALSVAAPYYAFEGDVLGLLKPVVETEDLVLLVWESIFDVRITLAKVLGRHGVS